jgi:cytochrome c oxidase subunit II
MKRRSLVLGAWCLVLLAAATSIGCEGNQSMFNPQGPAARSIAGFGWLLMGISTVVYVAVLVALGWALMRRRRPEDDQPATASRLTLVIASATAVTAAILVTLTISSEAVGRSLTSPTGPGAITLDVVGHQWWWEFQYRDVSPQDFVTSPNELHIPVGTNVVLKAQSRDVIHSFWVPNLQGKRDLIPGIVTSLWIQADQPGVYRGQCAEFCGHQHAKMSFVVVAEPMTTFLEWIRNQRQPAVEPATDEHRRGRELFMQSTSVTCHTIRGTDAGSRVGPDLTHVGSRRTVGAGTLPNTHEHIKQWVSNPQRVKPGIRMPPSPLSPDDLERVISYLRSLR